MEREESRMEGKEDGRCTRNENDEIEEPKYTKKETEKDVVNEKRQKDG